MKCQLLPAVSSCSEFTPSPPSRLFPQDSPPCRIDEVGVLPEPVSVSEESEEVACMMIDCSLMPARKGTRWMSRRRVGNRELIGVMMGSRNQVGLGTWRREGEEGL